MFNPAARRCYSISNSPRFSVAVERIYGGEQTGPLDQPWLVVRIDVKDEHEVLGFEIAANRRMMSDAGAKYLLRD